MSVNPVITSPIDKPSTLLSGGYTIYAYAYDPATGRTFVSGTFSSVRGLYPSVDTGPVSRSYIAAFEANGSVSTWYPTVSSVAEVMVIDGSALYIGGSFTGVNGSDRWGFAALDTTTGALLSLNPQLESYDPYQATYNPASVYYITVDTPNNRLHLSGDIARSSTTSSSVKGNIIINKTTGAYAGNLYAYYNDSEVYPEGYGQAVLSGGKIYYVGYMDSLDYNSNSYTLGGFLSYNASTGVPNLSVLPVFRDSSYYMVRPLSLVVLDGIIYFVGNFASVNGTARQGAAAIDATSGALYSWSPNIYGRGDDIRTDGTYFYVFGYFFTVNGVSNNHFAVLDTSGDLVSTNKLYKTAISPYYLTNGGLAQQLVSNGVMQVVSNTLKVWDTRYQSPRN
jgi:hypothetical protein